MNCVHLIIPYIFWSLHICMSVATRLWTLVFIWWPIPHSDEEVDSLHLSVLTSINIYMYILILTLEQYGGFLTNMLLMYSPAVFWVTYLSNKTNIIKKFQKIFLSERKRSKKSRDIKVIKRKSDLGMQHIIIKWSNWNHWLLGRYPFCKIWKTDWALAEKRHKVLVLPFLTLFESFFLAETQSVFKILYNGCLPNNNQWFQADRLIWRMFQ